MVHDPVEATRPSADRAGVAVRVDVPDSMTVLADGQRPRQVLDNLLSNAVKYSRPGGSVEVRLLRTADRVVIDVADTGMGIAENELGDVFGRFFRGGEAIPRQLPGTGLGLSIVASIVAAHGGTVTVESEPGRGSTFRVTLPDAPLHQ